MKDLFQQPRTFHWDSCISLSFSAKFYRIHFPHLLRLGNKIQQHFIVRIKLLIISYNSQRLYRLESVNHLSYASILFPNDFDWKLIRGNELTYTSEWSFNSIITLKHCSPEINIYKQNLLANFANIYGTHIILHLQYYPPSKSLSSTSSTEL